jgi:hypothetical protein
MTNAADGRPLQQRRSAAALIAWSEFRRGWRSARHPLDVMVPVLFSLVWARSPSGVEHRLRQAPGADQRASDPVPGQHIFNGVLLAGIPAASCSRPVMTRPSEALFVAVLIAAALLGILFVLLRAPTCRW